MTEDLFFPARWQQKRSLPSLRVDNSSSGKTTHYCFGANSDKMARSLKTTKRIYLFISVKPASLSQREVKINTPLPIH